MKQPPKMVVTSQGTALLSLKASGAADLSTESMRVLLVTFIPHALSGVAT